MERVGIILCTAEERMFIPLMMWLQNHHGISCVNMLACRDTIDVLSSETGSLSEEMLRNRMHDLIQKNGATFIAVVDSGSVTGDGKGGAAGADRLSAARERAQSWFPNLTVVGLSVDERSRVLPEATSYHRRAG